MVLVTPLLRSIAIKRLKAFYDHSHKKCKIVAHLNGLSHEMDFNFGNMFK